MSSHILIVDDNGTIRGLLCDALKAHQYRVTSAANGAAMRQHLSQDDIDAVVLDLRLPGDDGHSLALHAKERGLPVVMISGSGDEREFSERIGLRLLRKPFRIAELVEALETALASRGVNKTQP